MSMEFLIVVTLASLTAAALLGILAWRARDEARRRSAARVAALAAAAGSSDAVEPSVPVAVSSLFGAARGATLTGAPVVTAAVVLGLAVALAGIAVTSSGESGRAGRRESVAPATQAPPIELISMRHARSDGTLTVTGLVRNPPAGATVSRITAIVSAFDGGGRVFGSGSAPLDLTVLTPGGESPFVVSIPNAAGAARYRVGFRSESGAVRHVDRRAEQLARFSE